MTTDVLTLPRKLRLPLWGIGLGVLAAFATLVSNTFTTEVTAPEELSWETQGASNCSDDYGSFDAFIPGMRGHGACTRGGFVPGTTVIDVTNLNTSGTGSFKAAMDAGCPKVILFDVSGHVFQGQSTVYNNANQVGCDNASIVGASAPGQFAVSGGGASAAVSIGGANVTIDHMIVTSHGEGNPTSADSRDALNNGWEQDGKDNKIVLNSAIIWGMDETIQCYDSDNGFVRFSNGFLVWQSIIGLAALGPPRQSEHRYGHMNNVMCLQSANIRSLYVHNHGRTPFTRGDGLLHANNVSYNSGFQNLLSQPCGDAGGGNDDYRINIINNVLIRGPNTTMSATMGAGDLQDVSCKSGTVAIYENGNADKTSSTQSLRDCSNYACLRGSGASGNTMVGTPNSYSTAAGFVAETFDSDVEAEVDAFVEQILTYVGPRPADRLSYVQTRMIDQTQAGLDGTGTLGTYVVNDSDGMTSEGGFAAITDTGSWDASAQCSGMPTGEDADAIDPVSNGGSGLTALHEWVIECFYDSVMPAGYREAL